jgi:CheY-like chemotaxis protein
MLEAILMVAPDHSCLTALRILVVEDETLISQFIEDTLSEAGATILGVGRNVPEALELIERTQPNAVTLNGKLDGALSGAIAERLDELGVPLPSSIRSSYPFRPPPFCRTAIGQAIRSRNPKGSSLCFGVQFWL